MASPLEFAKWFKKTRLENNVKTHLRKNYDWKVARAAGVKKAVAKEDKDYRNSIVAELNRRLASIDSAQTIEELDRISYKF